MDALPSSESELTCVECGTGFVRPGKRGPVPTRCDNCKAVRKRAVHVAQEQRRQDRLVAGVYRCGRCKQEKPGQAFAKTSRKDGCWCRTCFREDYVERSGGLIDKECSHCGDAFQVTRRNGRQVYCSRRCKERVAAEKLIERNRQSKAGRICAGCGGEIPITRIAQAVYCTDRCRERHAGPLARRRSTLKNKYGMTLEQFDALLVEQGGRCAICRTDDPGKKGIWHIDHCHGSGVVRGLLCSPCNTGLGHFKDSIENLVRAVNYVARARDGIKPVSLDVPA